MATQSVVPLLAGLPVQSTHRNLTRFDGCPHTYDRLTAWASDSTFLRRYSGVDYRGHGGEGRVACGRPPGFFQSSTRTSAARVPSTVACRRPLSPTPTGRHGAHGPPRVEVVVMLDESLAVTHYPGIRVFMGNGPWGFV